MRPGPRDSSLLRLLAVSVAAMLFVAPIWCGHRSAAQGPATVRIEPATLEVQPGEMATVSIVVDDVTDLFGFELKLGFNPAHVAVVDADPATSGVQIADGDFLSLDWKLQNAVDNEDGFLAYAVCQVNPSPSRSGSGVLATVTWRAEEVGTSPLELYDVILAAPLGVQIPAEVQNGQVVVTAVEPAPGATPTGSPTPSAPSPTPQPSPIPTEQADADPGPGPATTPTPTTATGVGPTPGAQDVTQEPASTPSARDVTGEPTAAVGSEPSDTPGLAETPLTEDETTATPSDPQEISEAAGPDPDPTTTQVVTDSEPSRWASIRPSSGVLLAVAAGCTILGVGALVFASRLWSKKEP